MPLCERCARNEDLELLHADPQRHRMRFAGHWKFRERLLAIERER